MIKRLLSDYSVLFLLIGNSYCIWYYLSDTSVLSSIVWIYWWQSIIIGIFNFFDILTIRSYDVSNTTLSNGKSGNHFLAFFFLMHYGFFHLVYFIFLSFGLKGHITFNFILIGLSAFTLESIISFRKKKQAEARFAISTGKIFMLPYVRIIPMHLSIMLMVFLPTISAIFFLLLKTVTDIIAYFMINKVYSPPQLNKEGKLL